MRGLLLSMDSVFTDYRLRRRLYLSICLTATPAVFVLGPVIKARLQLGSYLSGKHFALNLAGGLKRSVVNS